jgi:WS/DGAT/MGAT family acyltransferase
LFWYAESALPIFRPIIGGLYILDRPPDRRVLKAGCQAALKLIGRLRQRVVEAPFDLGLPEWVDDPHFDEAYHLRFLSVQPPGTMRDLLELVAALFATPLDRERPLWEAYVIEGIEGQRAAYFIKMHHSVVDGVGSLALLNILTQKTRTQPIPRVEAPRRRRRGGEPGGLELLQRLALDNIRSSAALLAQAVSLPLQLLTRPGEVIGQARGILRGLRGVFTDAGNEIVHDPLARSTSGLSRRLDTMEIPLNRLRAIKAHWNVTINDVVLTALAGALRDYHLEHRIRIDALNCMVPMNLRGRDERDILGNRVGMFNIILPLAEKRAGRRLERIVAQTRRAKSDGRSSLYPFLVQTLTLLPGAAFRWLARHSLERVNVACTNIPGVPERRFMAGAEVLAIHPFASVVQGTPLVIALLSYGGMMEVGIDTDPEAIPDPHRIVELFNAALDELDVSSKPARGKPSEAPWRESSIAMNTSPT